MAESWDETTWEKERAGLTVLEGGGGGGAESVCGHRFGEDGLACLRARAGPALVDVWVRAGGLAASGGLTAERGSGLSGRGWCCRIRLGCQEFVSALFGELVE